MAKVRWSQKCAGGCGRTLYSGASATRLHKGYWCFECLTRHRTACLALNRR